MVEQAGRTLTLGGGPLSLELLDPLLEQKLTIAIGAGAWQRVQDSRDIVEKAIAEGRVLYGNEPAAYEAAPHVTRAMLEAFGVVGTPQDCARQLEKYVAAGVTLPILLPLGCAIEPVIEVGRAFLSANAART